VEKPRVDGGESSPQKEWLQGDGKWLQDGSLAQAGKEGSMSEPEEGGKGEAKKHAVKDGQETKKKGMPRTRRKSLSDLREQAVAEWAAAAGIPPEGNTSKVADDLQASASTCGGACAEERCEDEEGQVKQGDLEVQPSPRVGVTWAEPSGQQASLSYRRNLQARGTSMLQSSSAAPTMQVAVFDGAKETFVEAAAETWNPWAKSATIHLQGLPAIDCPLDRIFIPASLVQADAAAAWENARTTSERAASLSETLAKLRQDAVKAEEIHASVRSIVGSA